MKRAASSRSKSPKSGGRRPRPRADVGVGRSAASPEEIAQMIRRALGGGEGILVDEDSAMKVGTVYACVRILAESVALLPIRAYRTSGEDEKPITDHPLAKLFQFRPNRFQTPFEFKRLVMVHLLLGGNHYSLIRRVGLEVRELIPFDNPRRMRVEAGPDLMPRYTYENDDGSKKQFAPEEILHLRALSTDGLVGMSVLSAAAQAVGVALQAEKHGANILKNGANVGGVLQHPGTLSSEAATRLRDSFDDRYSGSDNAGKTVLLEEGMTFSKIGMTASESQFIESRKFQRSDIGMFFGVPPHMYGDIERGTSWGSGIEQQGVGFVTYTLLPWLTNITQGLNASLVDRGELGIISLQFGTEPLTKADFLTRQQGNEIMLKNGALSPNEWRRREGMSPRDGGEKFTDISSTGDTNGSQGTGTQSGTPQAPQDGQPGQGAQKPAAARRDRAGADQRAAQRAA